MPPTVSAPPLVVEDAAGAAPPDAVGLPPEEAAGAPPDEAVALPEVVVVPPEADVALVETAPAVSDAALAACLERRNVATLSLPLPDTSTKFALPRSFVTDALAAYAPDPTPDLRDVARVLTAALDRAGYAERAFHALLDGPNPVGFALVTRMERIDRRGVPLQPDRFLLPDDEPGFQLARYLSELFFAPVGLYRVIILTVSTEEVRDDAPPLSASGAQELLDGPLRLSSCFESVPFTFGHELTAFIYEFERRPASEVPEGEEVAVYRDRSLIGPAVHLRGAGLFPPTN